MAYCPTFILATYNALTQAAYQDPYDLAVLERIDRTLTGGIYPGCEAYGTALANAAIHMRTLQAAAVGEERRHTVPGAGPRPSWYGRRLGRQTPRSSTLPLAAPGETASTVKYRQWQAAVARGSNPRTIALLRGQFEALFEQERLARELQRRPALANGVAGCVGQMGPETSPIQRVAAAAETALRGYRALSSAAEGIQYGRDAIAELQAAVQNLTEARDAAAAAIDAGRQVAAAARDPLYAAL